MKKIISLILALIMTMAIAPISSFAYSYPKPVENIEITIDPKIAGKTPAEFADFLTVSGEGVVFDETTFKNHINLCGRIRRILIASCKTLKSQI